MRGPGPVEPWRPPEAVAEYRLIHALGEGGMGAVWLAEDTLLGRPAAVKFPRGLRGPLAAEARLRFLLEGRALARLRHPNVVAVYCAGTLGDQPYLATELVLGPDLGALPLPADPEVVRTVAVDLARGLSAAHRAGILHRDVKPANALRSDDGAVKLVDFGLAAIGPPAAEPGRLAGTPHYLAPELWSGGAATRRTDLYALGVLLYRLLTGHHPHE